MHPSGQLRAMRLGALQVSAGVLLFFTDTLNFILERSNHGECIARSNTVFGSGFWAGGFFVLSGLWSMCGRHFTGDHRHLTASLVLNVFGLVLALIMTAVYVTLITTDNSLYYIGQCVGSSSVPVSMAHMILFCVITVINLSQVVSLSVTFIHSRSSVSNAQNASLVSKTAAHNPVLTLTLGIVQASLGMLLFIFNTGVFAYEFGYLHGLVCNVTYYTIFGSGFWAGAFFIVIGGVVISHAQCVLYEPEAKSRWLPIMVLLNLVGAVLSLILALVAVGMSFIEIRISCFRSEEYKVAAVHAGIFFVIFVINFGHLVSANATVSSAPRPAEPIRTNINTVAIIPPLEGIATAMQTHPV
ncbi:uncharacterized protein LOC129588406 [Paramacrobiotus metropolitanus]|uniref:uncharacterized protein LOC129588406 n=1 Tax=Paramacrobiotus metropolitanus TaxID=2943436 RepID=UPI002445EB44|nr:uncharacterized protein LOC129588406 [Paramacrobiotus metropolitanus]